MTSISTVTRTSACPGNLNVSFAYVQERIAPDESEGYCGTVVWLGVFVPGSTGPSYVLRAIGLDDTLASASIPFWAGTPHD